MSREAYKVIVFPHGEVEMPGGVKAFKYIFGGVLISTEEVKMPPETIIMDEGSDELTYALLNSRKYTCTHNLGTIDSAMFMLGDLTPDHDNIDPV